MFCSKACHLLNQKENAASYDFKCKKCGKSFTSRDPRYKFCSPACYHNWRRGRVDVPFEERFWKYVYKTDGCWFWIGSNDGDSGYGRIKGTERKNIGSHIASWQLHFGTIPKGHEVCHRCDNPQCVRPDHLFLGTHLENMRDSKLKGVIRHIDNRGERHGMSKLTADQVLAMRSEYRPGNGASVAIKYGVSRSALSGIIHRRLWRHV